MQALIIIDAQNDFMPGGALEVNEGNRIIPVINELQTRFELIIATQDWHPAIHKSFASNHSGKKVFEKMMLLGKEQILWPDHCVQNSEGADFHPDLETKRVEAIIRKGMDPEIDSYSGFYDNGHQKSTGLSGYLRERKVTDLYFCGLAADICVNFSIRDAIKEGFNTYLVEDATRPWNTKDFAKVKRELTQQGCKIIRSEEVV